MAANQTIINSLISGDRSGLNIIVLGAGATLLTIIFRVIKNFRQSKKIDWFEVCRVLVVAMGFGFILVIRFDKDLSLSKVN